MLVIDASVILASRRSGTEIANWSFPLTGAPGAIAGEPLVLDEETFERKMTIAARYRGLAQDVDAAIRELGREAFRIEAFAPETQPHWMDRRFLESRPYYEVHGETRVASGKYGSVIRYRQHILPVAEELRKLAETG